MMRVVLSTPFVLNRLNRGTRPYNFLLCPLVDATVGFPQGVDRERCTFIAAFTKDRNAWLTLACINTADGRRFELALEQDVKQSKIVPQTYRYVLHFYPYREESKSLAPDGSACDARTRGVLQRASIVTGQQWFVGKETDRRWEFGEDLALLRASKAMVYRPGMTAPDSALRQRVAAEGVRVLIRNPDPKHISTSYVERSNWSLRTSNRRYTRLSNGFSRMLRNHEASVALNYFAYNFVRIHRTLRMTPAMAAGVTDRLWDVSDIVELFQLSKSTKAA